jgi:hypothetical protein
LLSLTIRRLLLLGRRGHAPGVAPAHVRVVLPAAAGAAPRRLGPVRESKTRDARVVPAQELVCRELQLQLVQLRPQRVVMGRHHHHRVNES